MSNVFWSNAFCNLDVGAGRSYPFDMDITATSDGTFIADGRTFRCAIGKAGMVTAADKREGDNKSPIGTYKLRGVYYRADRLDSMPGTVLQCRALRENDGWCDDPNDPQYNRHVVHPYPASAERLWRDDHIYDIIVVLDHNTNPVVPGLGSAIFLHVARDGYEGTEGCIALEKSDLLWVLARANSASRLTIAL